MVYKYVALQTSWGIVVFIELKEILNPSILQSDIIIDKNIYLRIEDTSNATREMIIKWVGNGVKSISKQIQSHIGDDIACFVVSMVDFSYAHFQEEGLYCAARGWLDKYYNLEIPEIEFRYDKENNKYIFNIPELDDLGNVSHYQDL